MSTRAAYRVVAAIGVVVGILTMTVVLNSRRWIGAAFPGFFVLSNRVVPSITLPGWLEVDDGAVMQHEVVAVDGTPVGRAGDVYAYAIARGAGVPIRYLVRDSDGTTSSFVTRSRRFSSVDYLLIFAAYVLNGVAFVGVALFVFALRPRAAPSTALLVGGVATGLWVITAADLYGPYWFSRLHVLAEALFGGGLIHFALVFPVDRLTDPRRRRRVLTVIYGSVIALAVWYEAVFHQPGWYTTAHLMATATHGLAVSAIMGSLAWSFVTNPSPLARRRTGIVALGSVLAFVVPGAVLWTSAMLGGAIPVNAAACTAFVFPLSIGFAVVKRDLFEIDVLLRRVLTYVATVCGLAVVYLVVFAGIAALVPMENLVGASPGGLAILNVGMLLLFTPLRARIQAAVDRVFFCQNFDAALELEELSRQLATARTVNEVDTLTRVVLEHTLSPIHVSTYVREPDGAFRRIGAGDASAARLILPTDLASRLLRGQVVARYEWDDRPIERRPAIWDALAAAALVPAPTAADLVGVIVLGARRSGRTYTIRDVEFLRALGAQLTLAITNAEAWEELREQEAKARQLAEERGHLADMRTRFVTNASHEFRTPLTAIQAATDILDRYGHRMAPEQRAERVSSIRRGIRNMTSLLDDVLTLGRAQSGKFEFAPGPVEVGALCREAMEDVRARASGAHRLLIVGDALPLGAMLDAKLLRHVLQNLLSNAIKYSPEGGTVLLDARRRGGDLVLRVTDEGIGIPAADQATLFEAFQRAANVNHIEGSGLGLTIAREAVLAHGGTIIVESTVGVGTTFIVTLPTEFVTLPRAGIAPTRLAASNG